jgi:hypothetical protein
LPRRSQPDTAPEALRKSLVDLLNNFAAELLKPDLRPKVLHLVPAFHKLRDLGASLIPKETARSAADRIIAYLRAYPHQIVAGDELMVVSGIGEWARRVRELRVQFGWWIYSGVIFRDMLDDDNASPDELASMTATLGRDPSTIKPDEYVLMREEADENAAYRWNVLNVLRRQRMSVKDKILEYLRKNVGKQITGEELRYLASDKKEWARRVRELRTEEGWPIATKSSGRPDLAVGVYVLEEDRQSEPHDRDIPDPVRVEVLERDHFRCTVCGWHREQLRPGDPRTMLELHHKTFHRNKGANTADNLVTLCNVHHDEIHRKHKR